MAVIVHHENLSGMNVAIELGDVKEYEAYKVGFSRVFGHSSILKKNMHSQLQLAGTIVAVFGTASYLL